MQYEIGRASRIGNRSTNQDRFATFETEGGVLLVLADGLGGQEGGEIAADTVVNYIGHELNHHTLPAPYPQSLLTTLLQGAHAAVMETGRHVEPPVTPGTTVVLCLIQGKHTWWAHVGDSRFYLFRNGVALYRTRDHSYVEHLYQSGQLSHEKCQGHPLRNYVTQCLGLKDAQPKIALSKRTQLQTGDIIMLCSDGLWEPLSEAQMGVLLMERKLDNALDRMAEIAEEQSYPQSDNISALALRVTSLEAHRSGTLPQSSANIPAPTDSLASAIEEIEKALDQYRHEMDD